MTQVARPQTHQWQIDRNRRAVYEAQRPPQKVDPRRLVWFTWSQSGEVTEGLFGFEPVVFRTKIYMVMMTLLVAGTTTTTIKLWQNEVTDRGDVSLASGERLIFPAVGFMVGFSELLSVECTDAGTGAEGLVVKALGYMVD